MKDSETDKVGDSPSARQGQRQTIYGQNRPSGSESSAGQGVFSWMTGNSVTANILMVILLIGGL
ncbi:MAG: hypothetical protein AAGC55_14840, partial [Myxococcota bacterium]